MRFYIHPINPNYGANSMDSYAEGWAYGIWEHPHPALEPQFYRYQSQTLESARDTLTKAEAATKHLASKALSREFVELPKDVHPHSDTAARFVARAILQANPVRWPWTAAEAAA